MKIKKLLLLFIICFITVFGFKMDVYADKVDKAMLDDFIGNETCNQWVEAGVISSENVNPFGLSDLYDTNCVYIHKYEGGFLRNTASLATGKDVYDCTILQLSYDSKSGAFKYVSLPYVNSTFHIFTHGAGSIQYYENTYFAEGKETKSNATGMWHVQSFLSANVYHEKITSSAIGRFRGTCPPLVSYKEVPVVWDLSNDNIVVWERNPVGTFVRNAGVFLLDSTSGVPLQLIAREDVELSIPSLIIDADCGDADDVMECRKKLLENQTCKDVIGDTGVWILKFLMTFLKIVVSIILLLMGTLDFAKAVFAQDESEIKKQQTKFIKRLVIALIIFLIPSILRTVFKIGHMVWPVIDDSMCGIFS